MILTAPRLAPVLYVVEHMREWDRKELFATANAGMTDDDLAMQVLQHWGPIAHVAWSGNKPVAVVGARECWKGVWTAWMFATDMFPDVAFPLTRFIKRSMIPGLVALGAHRCEARSIDGHLKAHRWLQLLGAVEESRLRRYGGNGEDFLVFRWDDTACAAAAVAGAAAPT